MVKSALRARSMAKGFLATATIIIFAISTHVNAFMGFFYIADRLPFVLSLLTGIALGITSIIELVKAGNAAIVRPTIELGLLGLFFIAWTAGNAFSTPRWDRIQPGVCSSISVDGNAAFQSGARTWCHEILALRAFVWIEWLIIAASFVSLLVYCIKHHKRGSKHVWSTPIATYDPNIASPDSWNPKARAFSHLSFGGAPREPSSPYAFDMLSPGNNDRFKTIRSLDSGPAVMGYQLDPFNVPKERPVEIVSSRDSAVQPSSRRTFDEQGQNLSRVHHQQHAYSTSIEHHHNAAYAY